MAVMYPSELPEQVRLDPARRAEAFVYDRLATLPEAYHVFYSVKWQANSRRGIPRDGEADFVLAHPALGVLVLEVKGGAVEYHGYQERWVSVDSRGRPRRGAADPVEQARESCHALLGIFCAQPDWDHRWLRCGYALAFPDIRLNDGQRLPPCSPAPLLLDATAFDALQPAIERAFGHWKGEDDPGALGEDRLAVVQALLDGWVVLPEAWSHQAIEARLLQLTEQQLFVLDLLRCQRRALIAGCAGSGKT
ncbi:MAG: NERD domain-containing protein, partial [Armatimonadetes bacterium]|nr:NERD domain-containing protein [Armatimonadota bacterium]